MSRFNRPPAKRWTAEDLDKTLGVLHGKPDAARKAMPLSPPVYPLVGMCRAAKLPEPVPEFVFHPVRKWRFDYAWPDAKIAVEVEGGVWTKGRHTRGAGFVADMEKYRAATMFGWRLLRYTPDDLALAVLQVGELMRGRVPC